MVTIIDKKKKKNKHRGKFMENRFIIMIIMSISKLYPFIVVL